jgi:8-oxo-dGTP diphosphatase
VSAPDRPGVVVGALIRDGGRVLLLHRRDGTWTTPGGWVERGETWRDALRREVREETGLAVEPGRVVHAADVVRPGFQAVVLLAEAHAAGTAAANLEPHKCVAVEWVPLADVPRLPLGTADRDLVGSPAWAEFVRETGRAPDGRPPRRPV